MASNPPTQYLHLYLLRQSHLLCLLRQKQLQEQLLRLLCLLQKQFRKQPVNANKLIKQLFRLLRPLRSYCYPCPRFLRCFKPLNRQQNYQKISRCLKKLEREKHARCIKKSLEIYWYTASLLPKFGPFFGLFILWSFQSLVECSIVQNYVGQQGYDWSY